MKKPHRNFVVEFKSGSRRQPAKSASIWGNMDLKAISREVEADAAAPINRTTTTSPESLSPASQTRQTVLIKPVERPQTMPLQEKGGDENSVQPVVAQPPSLEIPASTPAPKTRRGRPPKIGMTKMAAVNATPPGADALKVSPAKGGTRKRAAKSPSGSNANAALPKYPRKTRAGDQKTAAVNPSVGDEMWDLLRLEEENQRLRTQLGEKLRNENAELRKRLGQS
jgi:hypothetical protein